MTDRDSRIITEALRPYLRKYEITDVLTKIELMINMNKNSIDKQNI